MAAALIGPALAALLAAAAARGQTAPTNAATPAAARDLPAARFLNTCAGCHSLNGVKLNGPDLSHVAAWSPEQLQVAITRMEKNVGPLRPDEVADLAAMLRAADLRERLQAEAGRIQAQFAAKLAPANPVLGRQLFLGTEQLANGGLACISCHRGAGRGGNLGPELTTVHARMGTMPLISAIEKSAFKIMAPHYRRHPITAQEATHLAHYLATLAPNTAAPSTTDNFLTASAGLAGVAVAALVVCGRRAPPHRGPRLTRRERKG